MRGLGDVGGRGEGEEERGGGAGVEGEEEEEGGEVSARGGVIMGRTEVWTEGRSERRRG